MSSDVFFDKPVERAAVCVRTMKENGKAAHFGVFYDEERKQRMFIFGSKNSYFFSNVLVFESFCNSHVAVGTVSWLLHCNQMKQKKTTLRTAGGFGTGGTSEWRSWMRASSNH